MFSYHRLGKVDLPAQEEERREEAAPPRRRGRRWLRLQQPGGGSRRYWWWRRRVRVRVRVRVPALGRRVRRAVVKVVRRFSEGRAYLGDLFAGNYMFMQVNPSPPVGSYLQQQQKHCYSSSNNGMIMVKHLHPHPHPHHLPNSGSSNAPRAVA